MPIEVPRLRSAGREAGGQQARERLALLLAGQDRSVQPLQALQGARLARRHAFGDVQEQALDVGFHRRRRRVEGGGDRLDRLSLGDHLQQRALGVGELARATDRVDEGGDDRRIEHRAAGRHLADGAGELIALGDVVLQQVGVARGAFREQGDGVVGIVVLAEDHDARARMALADPLAGVDALALEARRHADVAHHHVGSEALGTLDQAVVVVGDTHHLEVALACQHRSHALADEDAVVGEEHGDDSHERQSTPSANRGTARRYDSCWGCQPHLRPQVCPTGPGGRRWRTMQA